MSRKKPKILFKGKYSCDGGCLMIFSKDFQVSFNNGMGDGEHEVTVIDGDIGRGVSCGHIEVKEKDSVFISDYDCQEKELFALPVGNYFVRRETSGTILEDGDPTGNMILERFEI